MQIGEVARRAGLSTSAVRYYEQAGLLPAPARQSGRRVYSASVLDKLAVLQFARGCGLSVREVRELLAPLLHGSKVSARWQKLATRKIADIDESIARMQKMKEHLSEALRCSCPEMDSCGATIRARAAEQRSRRALPMLAQGTNG